MSFRVYSGPHGAPAPTALERERMLYKEFSSLDEAMSWAGHVGDRGLTALLIEGDDGTRRVEQEITAAVGDNETEGRERRHSGRPSYGTRAGRHTGGLARWRAPATRIRSPTSSSYSIDCRC